MLRLTFNKNTGSVDVLLNKHGSPTYAFIQALFIAALLHLPPLALISVEQYAEEKLLAQTFIVAYADLSSENQEDDPDMALFEKWATALGLYKTPPVEDREQSWSP